MNEGGSQLMYSTFIDHGFPYYNSLTTDEAGNAYMVGAAEFGFPTTPGSYNPTGVPPLGTGAGPFIMKLNPQGSALVYSTATGGFGVGTGIVVDSAGQAYATGRADSIGTDIFPVTPGTFSTPGPQGGIFATKMNASGSGLIFSALFVDSAGGRSIAIDDAGNPYIVGVVSSNAGIPTTPGAIQSFYQGGTSDGFFLKLNSDATTLLYATYLGTPTVIGFGDETMWDVAVDAAGFAYVSGSAGSPGFPVTPDAFDTTFGGLGNGVLVKINPTPSGGLVYGTYIAGPAGGGTATSIVLDHSGNAYLCGATNSPGFPVTPGCAQPLPAREASSNHL